MDWLDLLDVQGTLTSKQFPPGQEPRANEFNLGNSIYLQKAL